MDRLILMTGITGFMGNAMAAEFIATGNVRILCLVSSETEKEKILNVVGKVLKFRGIQERNLEDCFEFQECHSLVNYDALAQAIGGRYLDQVWHIAAYMSYDPNEFNQSITFNAVGSTSLMKAAWNCGRFYFISTTGVSGTGINEGRKEEIPEDLLDHFQVTNPYTVSKNLAEYMLFYQSQKLNTRLTILRPGSIIGDSRHGWVNSTKYGYYSYLHVLKKFMNRNITFYLDIDPDKKFPVIHIDHLVRLCLLLSNRNIDSGDKQEIFHAINGNLMTAREHFKILENVSNDAIKVDYGEGTEGFNRVFNKMNKDNNQFLGVNCQYLREKMKEAIGVNNLPPDLTVQSISNVMRGYLAL